MLKKVFTQHALVAQQAMQGHLPAAALLVQASSRSFAKNTKLAKFDYLDPLVIED